MWPTHHLFYPMKDCSIMLQLCAVHAVQGVRSAVPFTCMGHVVMATECIMGYNFCQAHKTKYHCIPLCPAAMLGQGGQLGGSKTTAQPPIFTTPPSHKGK